MEVPMIVPGKWKLFRLFEAKVSGLEPFDIRRLDGLSSAPMVDYTHEFRKSSKHPKQKLRGLGDPGLVPGH
jgi:hypothetical protein